MDAELSRRLRIAALTALACVALAAPAAHAAPGAALVRVAGSSPVQLTNVNGTLFFTADDGVRAASCGESDGGGTVLVKDINPGPRARSRPVCRRGRHALLRRQRRGERLGAVEERRHRRRHASWSRTSIPTPARLVAGSARRTSTARCTSRPTTARTGSSCGRATAPPPAPSSSRTSTTTGRLVSPTGSRTSTARCSSRPTTATDGRRAVEERRHGRRHRPRQGHQPGARGLVARLADERQRDAVLRRQRRRARHRAVEERRHRRRHRPGQGHQTRAGQLRRRTC